MKRLLRVASILLAVSIAFVSCEKDDNKDGSADTPSASSTLVGKWNGVTTHSKLYKDGVMVQDTTISLGGESSFTIEFKQDGGFVWVEKDGEDVSTEEGKYSVESNKLKITSSDGENHEIPFNVTANKLTLLIEYEERDEAKDENGNTVVVNIYKGQTTYTLEKQ